MTRMSNKLRSGYYNRFAPIGPFTLQDANHTGWIGGQRSHSIKAAISASSDVFPDFIRVLQLKKSHAEVLKSTRSHEVDQSTLYLGNI